MDTLGVVETIVVEELRKRYGEVQALDGVAYSIAVARDGRLLVGGQNGQLRKLDPLGKKP